MTEEIKEKSEELDNLIKQFNNTIVDRILGIAALKSLLNDASGETELIRKAVDKIRDAFSMEDWLKGRIEKTRQELEELDNQALCGQTAEDAAKESAKQTLGIGGNK